ncbi:DUF1302 domain-containing protein [Sulfurimonas sp. SAG-AH-194-C20]|nr:DUF1302 family protein [Sulfurimonas sp. SAG-AH-194-C20]MDF1878492.1 DUF1302 domain-containing protein [Sulfurimonas sp. SAG-AH-194-C20]
MQKKIIKLSLACLFVLSSLHAQDAFEEDLGGFDTEQSGGSDLDGFGEDLNGFGDDESLDVPDVAQVQEKPSAYTLLGNMAFKMNYGYRDHKVKANKSDAQGVEYSGFNQAQVSTYLQFDAKLSDTWKIRISGDAFYDGIYDINSQNNYNSDILDTYQTQLRFDDTYIQGSITKDLDAKIGRQIVVWGKSDSIRITDVINPLDNRLPGLTDIQDLRLSTTMAKFDYYLGDWSFSAMAIIESRIFLEAAPRSEYFPVDSIFPIAPDPFVPLNQPNNSFEDMQYAFAANGVFSGWDLSFYAADVLNSKWHLEGTLPNASRAVSKIQMIGSAFNIVQGSWLFKSEVALIDGIKYNSTLDAKRRLDALLGIDYMGIKDTTLSLELANRHIFDYETQMSSVTLGVVPDYVQEDELQTAIRVTRSMQNDTLNATLLLSMFGHNWQYGGFFRASLEYDVMDALVVNAGVIDYLDTSIKSEKPFINATSNNDKIFADITYSF